jgi:hypothetical protein
MRSNRQWQSTHAQALAGNQKEKDSCPGTCKDNLVTAATCEVLQCTECCTMHCWQKLLQLAKIRPQVQAMPVPCKLVCHSYRRYE